MTIEEVGTLLDAEVLCGEDKLDTEVFAACASDMMSDVLAFVKDSAVLLTGLCNPQVIRTALMMDILCIVLVRRKHATDEMIEMAKEADIVLMETNHSMFSSCGILHTEGLIGKTEYDGFH